jgi:hypothetical protein
MKITHYNLFTVPISYYKGFIPLDLAHNLKEYILGGRIKNTTSYGAFSGAAATSFDAEKITEFIQEVVLNVAGCADLYNNIQYCINDFTSSSVLPKCVIINSWFNVQQPVSILNRHCHIDGEGMPAISGALYINIDKESSNILFENPNPYGIFYDKANYTFNPSIGDLILFPSWLIHNSDKINLTKNRIVISFNARRFGIEDAKKD